MLLGKISLLLYGLILVLGAVVGLVSLLVPGTFWKQTFNCSHDNDDDSGVYDFEYNGNHDEFIGCVFSLAELQYEDNQEQMEMMLIVFYTLTRIMGLFLTLFLVAMAGVGHSTKSCGLLLCATTLLQVIFSTSSSALKRDYQIKQEKNTFGTEFEEDDETMGICSSSCWHYWRVSIVVILVLTIVAVIANSMEEYITSLDRLRGVDHGPKQNNMDYTDNDNGSIHSQPGNEKSPDEETKLLTNPI